MSQSRSIIEYERALGVSEGLSTRWTQCISEDYNRLIWVGTNKGISRYDGYKFKNFSKSNSNLRNDGVETILRDPQGLLWTIDLGTSTDFSNQDYHRLSLYKPMMIDIIDPVTLEISSFDQHFASAPFRENEIRIAKETERGIWIGTTDHRYYIYNDGFHAMLTGANLEKYFYIVPRAADTFWADIDGAIYELDLNGKVIHEITIPDGITFLGAETIGQSLWLAYSDIVGSSTHIYKITEENNLVEISNPNFQFSEKRRFAQHLQVISMPDDQYLLRIHDQNFIVKDGQISDRARLNDNDAKTIHWYKDSYGGLWYTSEHGVKVRSSKPNNFQSYLNDPSDPMETRVIYSLDSSRLLVGSYRGIYEVERTNKREENTKMLFDGIAVALDIIKYDDDILFVSGHKQGITKLSISQAHRPKLTHLARNVVHASTTLVKDPLSDIIWMGSSSGLMKYDINNDSLTIDLEVNKDTILGNSEVTNFHYDANGLWVATYGGLFLIHPDSAVIKGYHEATGHPFSRLQHIYDDGTHFWLATNGKGLIKWNPKNEEYQRLTIENGLSSNYIHATYEDDDGFLWMPSDNGLMRMNKTTHEIVTYTTADGLSTNEFNRYAHLQDNNGNIVLGGLNGVIEFRPEEVNRSLKFNHNIVCTKIDVYDQQNKKVKSHLDEFIETKSIRLNPSEAYFNLEFTVTDFTKDDNYIFAYKIEELDSEWKYTRNNNLEIGQLPYGQFKLLVRAQGQGGQLTSGSMDIDIEVIRPFYKTRAFTIASILLGLLLIYLSVQYRLSILQKSNLRLQSEVAARTTELHEVNKSKDKLFAVIAHDLRGPISSFSNLSKKVQYLISKSEWDTLIKMADQIDHKITNLDQLISNLIPWVLVQSKDGENIRTAFSLSEIVEKTIDQLATNERNKNIQVQSKVPEDVRVVADPTAIEIIIRNLLSNAIKFSEDGQKIDIVASAENNLIVLSIRDNGVGIPPETLSNIFSEYSSSRGTAGEEGHGLGLKLSRDLAVRNGGSLEITSVRGEGTVAALKLLQS